jgi:CheY-like chemotaxis protein
MRILLVDDSEPLRTCVARLLKGRGFEVRQVADGVAALDCLAEFDPELVLTDLRMPGLDGLGLLRRLRAMPDWDAVPVVVMSAGASAEAEREVRRAGAAEFLAKPVDSDTLLGHIDSYC